MSFAIRKLENLYYVVFDTENSHIISDSYKSFEIILPDKTKRILTANFLIATKDNNLKVILYYSKEDNKFIEISKEYKDIYTTGFPSLQSKFGFAQNDKGLHEILYFNPINSTIKVLGSFYAVYPVGLINNVSDFIVVKNIDQTKRIIQNILYFDSRETELRKVGLDYKRVYLHGLIDGQSIFCVVELLSNEFVLQYFDEEHESFKELNRKFSYINEQFNIKDDVIIYDAIDKDGLKCQIMYDTKKNIIYYKKV